LSKIVD